MTQIETNYSMRSAPESWIEAAEASDVTPDPTPLGRKRVMAEVPTRDDPDMLSGTIFGIIVALAGGWLWYRYEIDAVKQFAWLAPILGVALAVAVRVGSGGRHNDVRATLSAVLYMVTVLSTAYMIERTRFSQAYGDSTEFFNSTTALLRHRITEPSTISFWLLGLIATIHLSYFMGSKRR